MRRAVVWIAGLVGIAALGRWLARRSGSRAPGPVEAIPVEDPAAELRRRLDDSRVENDDMLPADPRTLEERRADVHVKAQEAIDAMRESGL